MFAVWKGTAATLAVLAAVGGCIDFVAQLDDLGSGSYGLFQALGYVALRLPATAFDVLPAAALIGTLLGLGNLAVHRELTVMRASGVSHLQLIASVGVAGFSLTVLMVLLGESLAPSLSAYAREARTEAMHKDVDLADGQSAWLMDGNRILNLRRRAGEFGYGGGVLLFELGAGQELERVASADSAEIDTSDQWVLANYAETSFTPDGVSAHTARETTQHYGLSPDLLGLSVVRPSELDLAALQRYIRYLKDNDLDAGRYLMSYWARIAAAVSVALMTIIALPFVLGGMRSAATGARLLVGLVVGLGYYVIGQLSVNSGEVFGWDPVMVAWAPAGALLLVTIVALARTR